MNTDKVFTGFNNEDKELLLYRENSDNFIDLNIKEKINKNDIDLETLKYLKESIWVLKYMPESVITKLYNLDREKTLKTKEILLGLKGTITDLKETKTLSGLYFYRMPIHDYHYNWHITNREYGLYTFYNKANVNGYDYNLYKNFYDNKIYLGVNDDNSNLNKLPNFNNGMEYVSFKNLTLKDTMEDSIIEKKKVYEYANKLRKEEV